MAIRETIEQAGYVRIRSNGPMEYILTDKDGKEEIWFVNNGHAGFGIIYKGNDLEFARSV